MSGLEWDAQQNRARLASLLQYPGKDVQIAGVIHPPVGYQLQFRSACLDPEHTRRRMGSRPSQRCRTSLQVHSWAEAGPQALGRHPELEVIVPPAVDLEMRWRARAAGKVCNQA